MLKIKDLRKKSEKDLSKEASKIREEIAKIATAKYATEVKDVKKQRNLRKDLARVLTALNEDNQEVVEDKKEDK